jgi:hypothetical protein
MTCAPGKENCAGRRRSKWKRGCEFIAQWREITRMISTPPENMFTIPRPTGDDEAYFVAEEVAEP